MRTKYKLGLALAVAITLVAGVKNVDFLVGSAELTLGKVLFSAAAYVSWIIVILITVAKSSQPIMICKKTSLIMLILCICGFFAGYSPLGLFLILPFMGIADAVSDQIANYNYYYANPGYVLIALYLVLMILPWLEYSLIKDKKEKMDKTYTGRI